MKKHLILAFIMFNSASIFSQNRIGFKMGYHVSDMAYEAAGVKSETLSKNSYHATILAEIPFLKRYYFTPGISILQKGTALIKNEEPIELYPVYLEIPLNIITKIQAGKGKVFVGGGAYTSFGLSGTVITNKYVNGVSQDHSIAFGSDEDNDLKKSDLGLNLLAGYEINDNISFGTGYSSGVSNIWPTTASSLKNKIISFSLGITL